MKKKTQVINEVMGEIKFDYNWKRKVVYGLFLLSIIIVSCKKTEESPPLESSIKNYLHLSHTRTNNDPQLDSVTETINYKKFDVLMLGGDLAYLSSENNSTMQRIDSEFDVGNPNTLWALGNHDYTDLNRIQEFTNRPPYYATYKNGITFIVLDTQDSSSNIIGSQKKYLQNYYEILDNLRKNNINSEIFLDSKKNLGKQLTYANKKECPIAIICGENEFKDNKITLKNLLGAKGKNNQITFPKDNLINEIKKFI